MNIYAYVLLDRLIEKIQNRCVFFWQTYDKKEIVTHDDDDDDDKDDEEEDDDKRM